MRSRLFIVFFLLCSQGFAALNPKVMQITVDDGLINGNIHQITQGRYGFVWIATENGLVRYDGFDYKVFQAGANAQTSVSHNFVHSVSSNDPSALWIGTMAGVDRLDSSGAFSHFRFYNSLGNVNMKPALQVLPVASGCIVRSDDKLLYFCAPGKDDIRPILFKNYEPQAFVTSVDILDDDNVVVGTKNGDVFLATLSGEVTMLMQRTVAVTCVKAMKNGLVCVSFADGNVLVVSPETKRILYSVPLWGNDVFVSDMIQADDYTVLAATRSQGVIAMNVWNGTVTGTMQGLVNKNCSSVFEDRFGNVWVGHSSGGISVRLANTVDYVEQSYAHLLRGKKILAVAQTPASLYVGTDGNGLYIIQKASGVYSVCNSQTGIGGLPFDDVVTSLHIDGDLVWIGTYNNGIRCWSESQKQCVYVEALEASPVKNISAVFVDSHRNVWVGTYENGVVVFNTRTKAFDRHFTGYEGDAYQTISCNGITSFFEDKAGNMWLGSYYGITKISDTGHITIYRYDDFPGMRSSVVTTIRQDAAGRVWFGSLQGLSYYAEGTDSIVSLQNAQVANGLAVLGIIPQQDSSLLVVSPKVLYRYDSNKNDFGFVVPLPKGEFCRNALDEHSRLLFLGTDNGLKCIPTGIDNEIESAHTLQLTDVKVQGVSVYSCDSRYTVERRADGYHLSLPYYEKDVSISFSDFYFDKTRTRDYVYHLEGLNDRHVVLQNANTVDYTNLSGGDYVFYVRQLGSADEELAVHIHIAKAFWELTSFYVAMSLVIIILITIFFVRRMRRVVRMRNMLQKQVEARLKDIEEKNRQIELQKGQIQFQRDAANRQRVETEKQRSGLEKKLALLAEKDQKNEAAINDYKQKTVMLNKEKLMLKRKVDLYEGTMRDVVFKILLPSEKIEYVSPSVAEFTGYAEEDFYASPQVLRDMLPPDIKRSQQQNRAMLVSGQLPECVSFPIVKKDGSKMEIRQYSRYEVNLKGEFIALEMLWTKESGKEAAAGHSPAESQMVDEPLVEHYDWTGKNILVADADDESFSFIQESLRDTNISITRATTGDEAVRLHAAHGSAFDVILIDILLPKMNGFEVAHTLRENGCRQPIIAQTLYSNYEAKIQCFDAGCDTYLSKPYKSSDLQRLVLKTISPS